MRIFIVGALLAMIALAACSGSEGPTAQDMPAEEPPAQAQLPTVASTDDAAATDVAAEERPAATASPSSKLPSHIRGILDDLPESEGTIAEQPLEGGHSYSGPFGSLDLDYPILYVAGFVPRDSNIIHGYFGNLGTFFVYVDGPLPPDYFRVVGVDECLELRREPHPDAPIINCAPEGTVVRHEVIPDPDTNGHNTWNMDGTLWWLLENPLNGRIGWADARYLVDDQDALPTMPYHKYLDTLPPVVQLKLEGPLPRGFLRVTGVDQCLDVRAGPGLDSQILHCLPEGSVVRYQRPLLDGSAGTVDRDGVIWRFLAHPIHLVEWWPRTIGIGWADARHLAAGEGDHNEQELETITLDPIPHADFPDDIALIYRVSPNLSRPAEGFLPAIPLLRVYKRNGVVTREVLFSLDQPGPQAIPPPKFDHEYSLRPQVNMVMTPDLSRIVVAICHWADCAQAGIGPIYYQEDPPSPHVTDLYESTDGGVTWHHLDTLPGPWTLRMASAGNAESPPQLLLFQYGSWPDVLHRLYSDGNVVEIGSGKWLSELEEGILNDHRPLPDYEELEVNQNREGRPSFIPALWLSDNEILGHDRYLTIDLFGGAALGLHYFHL